MVEQPPQNKCTVCNGTCYNGEEICYNCAGTGVYPVKGFIGYMKQRYSSLEGALADILDKCNDIKEKVDEIMDKLNE